MTEDLLPYQRRWLAWIERQTMTSDDQQDPYPKVTFIRHPGYIQDLLMPADSVVADAITTLADALAHPFDYAVNDHRIAAATAILQIYATMRTFDP
jgi:hypothetical protein